MFQKTKIDSALGIAVNEHLVKIGIQTPYSNNNLSEHDKIAAIEASMTDVMRTLGLDLTDDSLAETPKRVAKMLVNEVAWGLDWAKFPKCTTVDNKMHYNELIIEKCSVKSICEHHLVYFGTAHQPKELGCWIAYIPKDKVIGLSKLSRITEYFSRRPQIQERLTSQIAESLKFILETDDVAVVIRAQHMCVLSRGACDDHSYTVTSNLNGKFIEFPALRAELMSLVNKS